MCKLNVAFPVKTVLLLILSLKFGSLTPATEFPTPMSVSITTAANNKGCTPNFINLTISDDLPKGDNSTKVPFFCNNWSAYDSGVYFGLVITYDEHRYFSIERDIIGNSNYLVLEIKGKPRNNTWKTNVTVMPEPYRNVTINVVPIRIDVKELNDRPSILPDFIIKEVPEDAPVGTVVANLSISDPDVGKWGELQVKTERSGETNITEMFQVVKISNNAIQIRTSTILDADKYWSSVGEIYNENGPTFLFDIVVQDGGGLSAISACEITIVDVGDVKPVCNNHTMKNITHWTSTGDAITNLGKFCRARNYATILSYMYLPTVKYSLVSDNCTLFNIQENGFVQLKNDVSNDIVTCTLAVNAADRIFTNLTTTFSLIIEFRRCLSDIDYMNKHWKTGIPGTTTWQSCPTGYNGLVRRYCNEMGVYQDPVYNCTKSSIDNIYRKLIEDKEKGQVDITEVLDKVVNATSETDVNNTLLIGDIDKTIDALAIITEVVTVNSTNVDNIADLYLQTVSNILDDTAAQTWKVNLNQTGSGADVVLMTTDRFVEKVLTTTKNITAQISKSNLYLKMGSVHACEKALNFPERDEEGVSDWARSRKDGLVIDCGNIVQSFSGIIYRNLSLIMSSTTNSTKSEGLQINAPVISFSLYPNYEQKLASPIQIKFQLYNKTLDNAMCSFWKESKSATQGFWSDEGCRQKTDNKNKDVVVCVCDHLTNFAVLMSPSSTPVDEDHIKVLSIISMAGCIVSIIFLVLSVAVHAYFWRFVKSVRSIIHTNLSCWLIIAYILFLIGINKTENKDVCTAMAVLLHLVFLVVIFGMLTEGCNLSYTVLKPLSTRKPGLPMMIASYVIAVIIVVISMSATQLQGYGTKHACWLSSNNGLIWAFLVPVFSVVLINLIIVVLVIRTMCGTTAMSKKSNKGRAQAALRCILVLMPVMGLTWGFGALSMISDTIAFQYIFAVFNSFQGLLIFIFHCVMDKKIKDAFSNQKSKWLQTQSFGVSEGKKNNTRTQETSELMTKSI